MGKGQLAEVWNAVRRDAKLEDTGVMLLGLPGTPPIWERHALHDENARVRIAAIHAWRKVGAALPRAELRRLLADEMGGVRLAIVRLLEDVPDDDAAHALLRDHDAWVRGIARKRLGLRQGTDNENELGFP